MSNNKMTIKSIISVVLICTLFALLLGVILMTNSIKVAEALEVITEIEVTAPTDYTINEDGSVTFIGDDFDIVDKTNLEVVESVQYTSIGIYNFLIVRPKDGYGISTEPTFTGYEAGQVVIVPIKKDTIAAGYNARFGVTSIKVGDYILAHQLGYYVAYVQDQEHQYYFNYKEGETAVIKGNEFGFTNSNNYFAGWEDDLSMSFDVYYPGQKVELTKNLSLLACWTTDTMPTEGDIYANFYLEDDIQLTDSMSVPEGDTASIDLNGHIINLQHTGGWDEGYICNEGTLAIYDSNPTIPHYFEFNRECEWEYIESPSQDQIDDSILYTEIDDETEDGTIIKVLGGAIVNGGQGAIKSSGKLILDNVNFIGNSVNTSSDGGAIACNGESADINNCKFLGNYAESQGGAIGINTWDVEVYLNDCVIMYNSAGYGGGIYSHYGTFELDGKTVIKNNYAETQDQNYTVLSDGYISFEDNFNGEIVIYAKENPYAFDAYANSEDFVDYITVINEEGYGQKSVYVYYDDEYQIYQYLICTLYTVQFYTDSKDVIEPQIVPEDFCAEEPTISPSRKGFNFIGWSYEYTEYEEVDFDYSIYNDIVFFAYFELDFNEPTVDNPSVTFDEEPDDCVITYQWGVLTGNSYYEIPGETSNTLSGDYEHGKFYCDIYIDGAYYGYTDYVTFDELDMDIDEETSKVTVTEPSDGVTYQWYYENRGELVTKEIKSNEDIKYIKVLKYDSINNVWVVPAVLQGCMPGLDSTYFYNGESIEVIINAPGAKYVEFDIYNQNGLNYKFVDDATSNYKFTYKFKESSYYYIEIYAYVEDYWEPVDYSLTMKATRYEWESIKLEGETSNTLSNISEKIGNFRCEVSIDEQPYVSFYYSIPDSIVKQPSVDNDFKVDVVVDKDDASYQWYEYSIKEYDVTNELDCLDDEDTCASYDSNTKAWSISDSDAKFDDVYFFELSLNTGDIVTFNVTIEKAGIISLYYRKGIHVLPISTNEMLEIGTYEYSLTAAFDGNFIVCGYSFVWDSTKGYVEQVRAGISFTAVLTKETYTEVEGQTTNQLTVNKDGKYIVMVDTYRSTLKSDVIDCKFHEIKVYVDKNATTNTKENIAEGKKIKDITKPTKEGYNFVDWYIVKEDGDVKANLDDVITSDLSIYATWTLSYKQDFINAVDALNNLTGEDRFNAIKLALNYYDKLTDEEKIAVSDKYTTLKTNINSYNSTVAAINQDQKDVTNNILIAIISAFAGLAALMYILKMKSL